MKPFYWRGTTNFGDYLNSWLWPRLLEGYLSEDDGIRLVGIGSLLKGSLNIVQGRKVIFGTGSGYGSIPDPEEFKDWLFYFVRGPLTAKSFGLSDDKAIVDGAWLLSQLPEFQREETSKSGVSFIPHWTTADSGAWETVCSRAGIQYIDPQGELLSVLKSLATSELVIAESLHGAIMADFFRTPWIPASISPKFLPFKWVDWFQSIELDPAIVPLPLSDRFEYLYCGQSPRNIDYRAAAQPIAANVGVVESRQTNERPGRLYAKKIRLKRFLRDSRRRALQGFSVCRNVYPLSRWNETHQAKLAKTLNEISKLKPFLSAQTVRNAKVDQLSAVTEKLKTDYRTGGILPLSNSNTHQPQPIR